jgi:hypothetical protein
MDASGIFGRDKRAVFLGVVAYGDDVVPINAGILIHVVGGMVGNVNLVFFHDGHRSRIESMGLYSCAIDIRKFILKIVEVTMGHLASTGISGTKYQYVFHFLFGF